MSSGPDTNFDGRAAAFEEDVYGSSKGYARFNVLWEDLLAGVPRLEGGGLSVLDAGGGAGHLSLRLGRLGNRVLLCDPSREMVGMAREAIRRDGLADLISTVRSPIQELRRPEGELFDVIACHAVLEWLADPKHVLRHLVGLLTHDGCLSLMFYNRNALMLKRVLRGELSAVLGEHEVPSSTGGWGEGARPLAEEVVRGWSEEFGLRIRSKAGIRIFHDHLPPDMREEKLEDLLEVEKELRAREPFASLGQHIHLICDRPR